MTPVIDLDTEARAIGEMHRAVGEHESNAELTRIHIGTRLREVRQRFPKSGPKARGWIDFLTIAEIPKSTACRYIREAEVAAGIRATVARTAKQREPFHILIAVGELRESIKKIVSKWPEASRVNVAVALRDLATDYAEEYPRPPGSELSDLALTVMTTMAPDALEAFARLDERELERLADDLRRHVDERRAAGATGST
jgi:molybdopterin converting factor small subunit